MEVQDAEGNPFPELGLDDYIPFSGDRTAHEVRWRRARPEEVNGRVVRLRVLLGGRGFTRSVSRVESAGSRKDRKEHEKHEAPPLLPR